MFPREVHIGAAEVTIGRSLLVDRAAEIEHVNDAGRTQFEMFADECDDGFIGDLAGTEGIDEDGDRTCDADGIGKLDLATVSDAGSDDILRYIASCIRCRTVDFRRILAGECAAAMTGHAAIGIDDDLTAGKTGIPLRAADDETAGRIDEVLRILQEFGRDGRFNDMFHHIIMDLCLGDIRIMLRGNDDGIHTDRLAVFIFYSDLRLAVRTEIGQFTGFSDFCQTACQTVRQCDRHRQIFRRFVRCIAEHHPLIACADIIRVGFIGFGFQRLVDAHGDIRRLLIERDIDPYAVSIEAIGRCGVADVTNGIANDFRESNVRRGGDLTEDMYLPRGDGRLTSDTAIRVLCKDRVKNGVRDLVTDLIRMPFGNRFRSE